MLHNMVSSGPMWPLVDNGGQLWSRISSLNELVHFKAGLRDLCLVYQAMAFTAVWDKICKNRSKVAYNRTTVVTVPIYDRLGPYFSLHFLFWAVLSLSVRFDHITIKETHKREIGQKSSIIIQNVLPLRGVTNCGHIWHSITNSDQLSPSATEKARYDFRRQLVAYIA